MYMYMYMYLAAGMYNNLLDAAYSNWYLFLDKFPCNGGV